MSFYMYIFGQLMALVLACCRSHHQAYASEAEARSAELEEEMDRLGRQLQARRLSRASASPPAAPSSPRKGANGGGGGGHNASFFLDPEESLLHAQPPRRRPSLVGALSASFDAPDPGAAHHAAAARPAALRGDQIRRLEALEAKFAAHTATRPRASDLGGEPAAHSAPRSHANGG